MLLFAAAFMKTHKKRNEINKPRKNKNTIKIKMHIWLVLLSILLVPVHSMDTSSGSKGPLTIVEASSPVAQLSPVYGEQMTAMAQLEVEDVGAQDMAIDRDYSRHGNDNNNNDNSNNNGNNDNTNSDGVNNRGKSFISTPEDQDTKWKKRKCKRKNTDDNPNSNSPKKNKAHHPNQEEADSEEESEFKVGEDVIWISPLGERDAHVQEIITGNIPGLLSYVIRSTTKYHKEIVIKVNNKHIRAKTKEEMQSTCMREKIQELRKLWAGITHLKVGELKSELKFRKLSNSGKKAVLIKKLRKAIDDELVKLGCKSNMEHTTQISNVPMSPSSLTEATYSIGESVIFTRTAKASHAATIKEKSVRNGETKYIVEVILANGNTKMFSTTHRYLEKLELEDALEGQEVESLDGETMKKESVSNGDSANDGDIGGCSGNNNDIRKGRHIGNSSGNESGAGSISRL